MPTESGELVDQTVLRRLNQRYDQMQALSLLATHYEGLAMGEPPLCREEERDFLEEVIKRAAAGVALSLAESERLRALFQRGSAAPYPLVQGRDRYLAALSQMRQEMESAGILSDEGN